MSKNIKIGDETIQFGKRIVFLSSYKDTLRNKTAYGPYWVTIKGYFPETGKPTHIIIHFEGYDDDFDVYIHLDDLPQLSYKFQPAGSIIYTILDTDRLEFIDDSKKRGQKITPAESYSIHNDFLYKSHYGAGARHLSNYGLTSDIINKLTVYDEWCCPVGPKFTSDFNLNDVIEDLSAEIKYNAPTVIAGSGKQWISVNVKGDGDCLFRAVANGLHYIETDGKEEWGYSNKAQDKLQVKLRTEAISWLCNPVNHDKIIPGGQTVYESMADASRDSGWVEKRMEPLGNESPREFTEWIEYIERSVKVYCEEKLKRGTWGKDLEIFALANIHNVAINVYHKSNDETIDHSYDQFKARYTPLNKNADIRGEINIYLINWNHYRVMYPNIFGVANVDENVGAKLLAAIIDNK